MRRISRQRTTIFILLAVAVVLGIFIFIKTSPAPDGKYDEFAKCVANTSTTFYGAFWCPHCMAQKRAFGSAEQYLPYVECSTSDARGTLPVCIAAGVSKYPTWRFPDGSTVLGEQPLDVIAAKTGCTLPS